MVGASFVSDGGKEAETVPLRVAKFRLAIRWLTCCKVVHALWAYPKAPPLMVDTLLSRGNHGQHNV